MQLQGKVAIVNIASGHGIGRAIAHGLAPPVILSGHCSVSRWGVSPRRILGGAASRSQEEIDAVLRSGRVGRPEDMVPTVIHLCSDAGEMLTVHTIHRDIFLGGGVP